MAMIECPECKTPISSEAQACPKCGYAVLAKRKERQEGCVQLLSLAVVIGVVAFFYFTCHSSPPTADKKRQEVSDSTAPESSQSERFGWIHGGTLHNATVAEWKSATYANKLATAGDWLAGTKWKGHLNTYEDFDKQKAKAEMLVEAVDGVVTLEGIDSMSVTEIAAGIVTQSNDLGP